MNFRRSVITAELWRHEFARLGKNCLIFAFWKKDPLYTENFLTSVSKEFIVTPIDVLCSNVMKFGRRKIGKVVWYLPKKSKSLPGSPALATVRITHKMCQGQPQTMYSEYSRFHPNEFTFGGVIPELVNTVKTGRKVNAMFGWRLTLGRRKISRYAAAFSTDCSRQAEWDANT